MILGSSVFTVTRSAAGAFVDGFYVAGATTTWSVRGSLQPLNERELQLLPEASRTQARWILLYDSKQTEIIAGDNVSAKGGNYLALLLQDWTLHTALPYRAVVLGEITTS